MTMILSRLFYKSTNTDSCRISFGLLLDIKLLSNINNYSKVEKEEKDWLRTLLFRRKVSNAKY